MSYQALSSPSASGDEIRVNENMVALGQGFVWSHNVLTDTGLVVGFNGGVFDSNTVADATVTATDNTTNYVVAHRTTRALSTATATTNWTNTTTYGRVARAVFAAGVLTLSDERYSTGGIFDHAAAAGSGSVTSVSVVTANGVSGTVATATTTPAITITLGAVTPTSVAATGAVTGSNLSGTNTGNETTTTEGALINGATAKTTPVDADFLGLMDSAAANILKKLSWLNLKATLKTYFDTLYGAGSGSVTSVAQTVPAFLSIAGSPITTSGTLAITLSGTALPVLNGGTGTTTAPPFDLTAFYPGVPTSGALVARVPVARVVTFPINFAGSYGVASVAATASTAFDVQKNGVSVGTITFAAAAATATFVAASSVVTAAGDVMKIVAPATADTTLADPGFVLVGTR